MPVVLSSPMMATTHGLCSTTSATGTSSIRSGTPKWRPTGSRIFGANRRRQARDDFRFPLNHLGIRRRIPLRDHLLDELDGLLELLIRHRLDAVGMLEFQLFRDEHGADLQVARRALPPNPLEHLSPMLLPILRQIEQKALLERSARSLW